LRGSFLNAKRRGKRERGPRLSRRALALCALTLLAFVASTLSPLPPAPRVVSAQNSEEDMPAQNATFHRWGAVTLFHGLPSDRVRAIAQDAEGQMWFGTDAGLARYDGRRTETVSDEGLASRRILALRADRDGTIWVGTDGGAFYSTPEGTFKPLDVTKGKTVAAIVTPERGRAVVATSDGLIYSCRKKEDGTYSVEPLAERILPAAAVASSAAGGAGASSRQPLELTSIAALGETLLVGTRGRGLLSVERGKVEEVQTRPRTFYVETIEQDEDGSVIIGAQATGSDSGLFRIDAAAVREDDPTTLRPEKVAIEATGTVTALGFDRRGELYAGTDGRGVFRLRGAERLERFTFASTAGALRSDRVHSVFIDREGVAWFGTDRGVCRYDPQGLRVENVSDEPDGNFVRAVHRTSTGTLLAGTSRGLFVRDPKSSAWRFAEEVGRRVVFSIAEDGRGRVLVGTAGGLFVSLPPEEWGAAGDVRFGSEEKETKAVAGAPKRAKDEAAAKDESAAGENLSARGAEGEQTRVEQGEAAAASDMKVEAGRHAPVRPPVAPAVAGSVRAVAYFGGAVYVATTGRGVERLDADSRRTPVMPLGEAEDERGREVVSLYADESAGRLWIGTATAGAFYFDGQEVRSDDALAALSDTTVWGVSAGSGDWLWVATNRGLYARKSGGPLLEVLAQEDARGVAAAEPLAPQSSAPQAWCATADGGVVKVLIDEQFGTVNARLDAEQGLPSQSALAVLSPSRLERTVLIGTARGLAVYEPGDEAPVLRPSRLVASRPLPLEQLDEEHTLNLEYPQSGLVLDVAASSSRTFPEQFQYAFILQDAAGRVIRKKLAHDSQFQVESLPPGRYRVTARAFTVDLSPSAPFAFEFVVPKAPFPWTIASLSVLLALALVALLWGSVQHRKIVRAGAELIDANRQLAAARLQLANEAESERRRIARDLHDQTLADLRRLLLLADEVQAGASPLPAGLSSGVPGASVLTTTAALDPAALRAEIESISQEIRRICEDLSPSVLENVGFAAALEWAIAERIAHMPAEQKFAYEFACDEQLEERLNFTPGVQMQVYRIVQEAVSNVCRHAAATRVRLDVRLDAEGEFLLKLEDNGRGFDPDKKKAQHGRGLASIRARASMIDAEARWQRRPETEGGGTRFTLRKSHAANDTDPTPRPAA
jgi:signal transduction histidine kinase/ligand-binding sensor domain-containing protein